MSELPSASRRLRVDMHVHSHASFDCLSSPAELLQVARARRIDRVIIADHNEIEGALELHQLDPKRVLVGEEVKTREGFDIIGILLTEIIPKGTPARTVCELIRTQGGVVYLPHPFDRRRRGGHRQLDHLIELIDVVEVHNARSSRGANQRAEAWAAEHGKAMGAGSDAHTLRELGRGFVEVPSFEPDRSSLLAALRSGRVVGRVHSSRLSSLWSTYAKIRKRLSRN